MAWAWSNPFELRGIWTSRIGLSQGCAAGTDRNGESYASRLSLVKLDQCDEAVKEILDGLARAKPEAKAALQGEVARIYDARAVRHQSLGQHDAALADLLEAVRWDSTNADTIHDLGCAYFNVGSFQKAVEELTRAIVLDSTKLDYFAHRGHALRALEGRRRLGRLRVSPPPWQEIPGQVGAPTATHLPQSLTVFSQRSIDELIGNSSPKARCSSNNGLITGNSITPRSWSNDRLLNTRFLRVRRASPSLLCFHTPYSK